MNKLMTVVTASVCAVSLSSVAFAAENNSTEKQDAEALEEESPAIFEAGFDFDFNSADVWRNSVENDDMVMSPCVWADLTYFEPFWLGFYISQTYNLTDRTRSTHHFGLKETDYNVHLGATIWESDDEEYSFGMEVGHDWYTYHGIWGNPGIGEMDFTRDDYPNTREVYVKATFDNPLVNVYGMASYMYRDFGCYRQGMHYEIGFNKEVELVESLTAGVDWNVNFGDGRYLNYLYGQCEYRYNYDAEEDEIYDETTSNPDAGIGGTTLKFYLDWAITDWMSLTGTIAYTGVINGSAREGLGNAEYHEGDYWGDGANDLYPRDLLWGGIGLHISY